MLSTFSECVKVLRQFCRRNLRKIFMLIKILVGGEIVAFLIRFVYLNKRLRPQTCLKSPIWQFQSLNHKLQFFRVFRYFLFILCTLLLFYFFSLSFLPQFLWSLRKTLVVVPVSPVSRTQFLPG